MNKTTQISVINDIGVAIQEIIDDLRFCSPAVIEQLDPRVTALVITKLEEAQLWSTKILKVQP